MPQNASSGAFFYIYVEKLTPLRVVCVKILPEKGSLRKFLHVRIAYVHILLYFCAAFSNMQTKNNNIN